VEELKLLANTYNSYKRQKAMTCGKITQTTHDLMIGLAGVHVKDTQLKEI
jgi:hypothetical protein